MSAPRETKVPIQAPQKPDNPHEGLSMLMRLIWMMAGGVTLVFSLFAVMKARDFGAADAIFWIIVAMMVAARFLDVRFFQGATTSGEPATMRDFAQYVLMLLLGGGALWGLAHVVARRDWM